MKFLKFGLFLTACIIYMASCSKTTDTSVVSVAQIQVGQAISGTAPLSGAIKGTMITGTTYTISGDVTVNAGDTLLVQKGVTVNVTNGSNIIVRGTFISLGTKDAPNTFTDPRRSKKTGATTPATDSAYVGGWGGVYCDSACNLCVIKWTHLDFGGAQTQKSLVSGSTPGSALAAGSQYVLYFGNPGNTNALLILEDSWIYGSPDDATRFYGGYLNIMRNTMEKCGGTGGDGFNAKGGSQGNMAYNLIIGGATNGTKMANDGQGTGRGCMFTMYNNTYINDGWRNGGVFGARSGSVEIENASRALVYNNLIVNCLFGVRIAGGTNVTAKVYAADTAANSNGPITQTKYGYNFFYADSTIAANQFVPTNVAQAVLTQPQSTDIPDLKTFLGASYTFGKQYDGSSLVGKYNPTFKNYPLPNYNFRTQNSVDAYDFHLLTGSPAIGKATQSFIAITTGIRVDANFGSSEITAPGKDIGCYQTDGTGNQH